MSQDQRVPSFDAEIATAQAIQAIKRTLRAKGLLDNPTAAPQDAGRYIGEINAKLHRDNPTLPRDVMVKQLRTKHMPGSHSWRIEFQLSHGSVVVEEGGLGTVA